MKNRIASEKMSWRLPVRCSLGEFVATFTAEGLSELDFPGSQVEGAVTSAPREVQGWAKLVERALADVLAGKPPGALPPLAFARGTDFQKAVWRELQGIPLGKTISYGEIAARLGKPGAARAVGAACGANPIPVLVPCHRVLTSNRKLGGFSGGLSMKIELLAREGVREFARVRELPLRGA